MTRILALTAAALIAAAPFAMAEDTHAPAADAPAAEAVAPVEHTLADGTKLTTAAGKVVPSAPAAGDAAPAEGAAH